MKMKFWKLDNRNNDYSFFYIDFSKKYFCIEIFGIMFGVDWKLSKWK